jgi:menaquinone-specific isochorismate synthase
MDSSRGEQWASRTDARSGVVRGCRVERAPVRSFLCSLDEPRFAWADATATIAAGGAAETITTGGTARFERVRARADELFSQLNVEGGIADSARPRLYGGFAFTDEHADAGTVWEGYPGAKFVLPKVQLSVTADGSWLTTTALGPDAEQTAEHRLQTWRKRLAALPKLRMSRPPNIRGRTYTPSKMEWRDLIETATDRIRQGELRKVVLAQALQAQLGQSVVVPDALARLGASYPGCYRFLFEPDEGGTFFGATPERLVSVRGETVDTEALAGSTGRGETRAEDEWLANELAESEKNNHEHELVVEAIRAQLSGLTENIRTGERSVRRLETVQHLRTPVRATLETDRHVLELVEALHPTPAVGGLPPQTALKTIRELEPFERGWYAAPVGWFDASGDGTFAVAIRSALAREQTATLFAGAGIVTDSDADEEYDELRLKYGPILDVLT